ncbi:RdgB/HAM1 family non-canonical purine NTP pyrophosphatase [Paenibacillus yanchengensis]|uniref:dITP/XTP pyrophosphatase n=1 Tax=Paenibacillus yanchengensis TaxID=2035833 RepID=A0ABW4YLG5_9BACL
MINNGNDHLSAKATKRTIVIATKNRGKLLEFQHALAGLDVAVVSLLDYPAIADIEEDGDTFIANARKKAETAANLLGVPVLADDSGLCVTALGGAPGIYSARYAGEPANDAANNEKLLQQLLLQPSVEHTVVREQYKLLSKAQFVCVLSLYDPAERRFIEAEGTVDGYILDQPLGTFGFGYDPLFWLPSLDKSVAELTPTEKQSISHRGHALEKLLPQLEKFI